MKKKMERNQENMANSGRNLSNKYLILIGLLGLAGAIPASASAVTVTGVSGVTSACAVGNTGTFTGSSGGILLEAPGASTAGCYVGGFSGTAGSPSPSGLNTTYIGGLSGEGTSAQLDALDTGWYAEYGAICGGTGQCTASNSSTNQSNSGDIEVLVNATGSAMNFQIFDNTGTVDPIYNTPSSSGCGANASTKTFSVAANTICIEDMSTSGSISMTIGAPTTTPEPSTFAFLLIGCAVLSGAAFARRYQSAK